jgi:hypothetical protein
MNIIQADDHDQVFAPLYPNPETWRTWRIIKKAAWALGMDSEELEVFRKYTGRTKPPSKEVDTLVICAGRRSGKSFTAAIISCYLALFYNYRPYLSPGILNENEFFQKKIVRETRQSISLDTMVDIEVQTASFRTLRGRTLVACLCDEICFWMDQGARPDKEIIRAVKPALLTIPNSKLIMISSPYSQRGVFYEYFKQYYAQDRDDVLVWRSESLALNPCLDEDAIERDLRDDYASASAEWKAIWRADLATFLPAELIDELTVSGRHELPPIAGNLYHGFIDAAGGSGRDCYAAGIAHKEGDTLILDSIKYAAPPFDPFLVTTEFSKVFKEYWIDTVYGDRWASGWVEEAFRQNGLRFTVTDLKKAELYLEVESYFSRKEIQLLDNERLLVEFKNLERSHRKVGKPLVDHSPAGSDDLANACAGAFYYASKTQNNLIIFDPFSGDERVIQPLN